MSKKKDHDVVRPWVVDGIEEYDNPLPPWWVWLFNLTIVFAVGYLVWYHVMGKPGLEGELKDEHAAYQEMRVQKNVAAASSGQSLAYTLKDPARIEEGKAIFATNCSPCHGASGQGTVGPNLTDIYWIHGGAPENIVATISQGIPAKGMIAWEPILGPEKVQAAAAFVLSLQGTHPSDGKAPQGEPYKD